MQHLGTRRLETQRLILRAFTMDDASAMYRNWGSDPEVTRYLTWPTHTNEEVSAQVLADWVGHYDEADYYQWAIVPKTVGEPIGGISVVQRNDSVQSVHIGYCIGRRWWHQGITSEALDEVIRFFFEDVGANRIDSRHDPRNPHSGAVMAHCGMTREGTVRQGDRNNQGICDYTLYGILRDEYFASKG
ncbi:MAG TPA: GNAT family N-acetyltransferase [Candidatus Limiplasma sp.]|nr:GNAT family N-acetyltransferase [Candidatus Limiplasma sp.]HPS81107.1 GNAT family N-acetyltransferase [Candidatus Limiplasma sp.]